MRAYFARHAQVLIGSLGRITQQPFATLMTMAVIAVALALPLVLYLFLQNARTATANWNDAYNLSVYMDKKAGAARVSALAKQLQKRGDVAAVRIVTADQALAEFRRDSGFGNALDALADNPLPDTLIVTPTLAASTPQGTEALKTAIAAMPDVQTVQLDTEWVRRLYAMLDLTTHRRALNRRSVGFGGGAHRQQHHSPRHIEPARRNRGHEIGGRLGPICTPAVSLQRDLVRARRGSVSP